MTSAYGQRSFFLYLSGRDSMLNVEDYKSLHEEKKNLFLFDFLLHNSL